MAEYHQTSFHALYRTPMALALALQPAAQERRGQRSVGPDFADQAGDRAVEVMQTGPHKR